MSEVKSKAEKYEKRVAEISEKTETPIKEAALKDALTDLITKIKAEEKRAADAQIVIEEAEKAVQVAEDDLAGKKPEEPEAPVVEPAPVKPE